jgi:hypothetical protein
VRKVVVIITLVLITVCCRKEKDLLTGEIIGRIKTYEEDIRESGDKSGVEVTLMHDSEILSATQTDSNGQYRFLDIPYGKYKIDLKKTGYIKPYYDIYPVYHVGGYSPTIVDGNIYRVPGIQIHIDSVKALPSSHEVDFFIKITGGSSIAYSYLLLGYLSNSPDVTKDNYLSTGFGALITRYPSYHESIVPPYGYIQYFDNGFQSLKAGTIYIRLYPVAFGQSGYYYILPEAIGNPSNVVSFKWE